MLFKASKELRPKKFAQNIGYDALVKLLKGKTNLSFTKNNFMNQFDEYYLNCSPEEKDSFCLINDVSSDKARPELIQYAEMYEIAHQDLNNFELAAMLFIKNQDILIEVWQWLTIDEFDTLKNFKGNSKKELNERKLSDFKLELSNFFANEDKGKTIDIDRYVKTNKIAYIINHGSYFKNEYVTNESDTKFKSVKQRKAQEAALVYFPEIGKLQIKASTAKITDFLRNKFAEIMLEDPKFFDGSNDIQFFDLNKLSHMKLEDFKTNIQDEIKSVNITKIQGYLFSQTSAKLALADSTGLLKSENDTINTIRQNLVPTKVNLQFKFQKNCGRPRTIQFILPNMTNMNDSHKDQMLAKYLEKWEII